MFDIIESIEPETRSESCVLKAVLLTFSLFILSTNWTPLSNSENIALSIEALYLFKNSSLPKFKFSNNSFTAETDITFIWTSFLLGLNFPKRLFNKFKIFLNRLFLLGEFFLTYSFFIYVLKSSASISSIWR